MLTPAVNSEMGSEAIRIRLSKLKTMFCQISPQSRASRLLETYVTSSSEIDAYASCLGEKYRLISLPGVAGGCHLPPDEPWWDKVEDVSTVVNRFSSPEAREIQFDYEIVFAGTLLKMDSTVVRVRMRPTIRVDIGPQQGEPVEFLINQGCLDFSIGMSKATDEPTW